MTTKAVTARNVSRETLERLQILHDMLLRWNSKINLVSKNSVHDLWNRHIWDSAQLVPLIDAPGRWIDLGSGGGFPGLIVAILLKDASDTPVVLIESDHRKAAFLRDAIRQLELRAEVVTKRIEEANPQNADTVSARALAELPVLLGYVHRHLKSEGTALLMKGARWQKEIEAARESWSFDVTAHRSETDPAAAILELKDIRRA